MSSASKLLCAGHACGARADYGYGLASLLLRHLRRDPAFFPTPVDNRALDRFDRNGLISDVERAGSFARSRADPSRELREVVG